MELLFFVLSEMCSSKHNTAIWWQNGVSPFGEQKTAVIFYCGKVLYITQSRHQGIPYNNEYTLINILSYTRITYNHMFETT